VKQRKIPPQRDPEQRIYNRDTSHRLTSLTIDLGILLELVLCYLFFYTRSSKATILRPSRGMSISSHFMGRCFCLVF
jgi:hypothetical protein